MRGRRRNGGGRGRRKRGREEEERRVEEKGEGGRGGGKRREMERRRCRREADKRTAKNSNIVIKWLKFPHSHWIMYKITCMSHSVSLSATGGTKSQS